MSTRRTASSSARTGRSPPASATSRTARSRTRPASRADQGVPRHLGARHPLLPVVPAGPATVARELLTEIGIVLRADRRRERAPRPVRDGRGVRQRELRPSDHVSKTSGSHDGEFLPALNDYHPLVCRRTSSTIEVSTALDQTRESSRDGYDSALDVAIRSSPTARRRRLTHAGWRIRCTAADVFSLTATSRTARVGDYVFPCRVRGQTYQPCAQDELEDKRRRA